MDIGLDSRLEMFSNGGEVLNRFEKMLDEYSTSGVSLHALEVKGTF